MDPMELEFTPGDISFRPRVVVAAAPRTEAIREEERALELYTLVAVQRDCRVPLTCEAVFRDAPHQLGVPEHELAVEGLSQAKFLLRFGSPALRNVALAVPGRAFQVGSCVLNIMPWSRRIGASVGKLRFRARICLEGVPRHARNTAAVAQLFSNPSFVDEVDCSVEREEERFCFTVWVWTDAPNDLAMQGKLQLQEPIDQPDAYFPSFDTAELAHVRDAPLKTFDYDILIHLDRVLDYTIHSDSSGRHSFDSDISGIPFEDPAMADYPAKHSYDWVLGERDDRPARRISVHDRLGGRSDRHDRSPPRGGNGGGSGLNLKHRPPATRQDIARMSSTRRWDGGAGSSGGLGRRHGDGQVVKDAPTATARPVWRPKQVLQKGKDSASHLPSTDDSSRFRESEVQIQRSVDPMVEEAVRAPRPRVDRTAWTQRSLEPTAADAGPVLPAQLDGDGAPNGLIPAGQTVPCPPCSEVRDPTDLNQDGVRERMMHGCDESGHVVESRLLPAFSEGRLEDVQAKRGEHSAQASVEGTAHAANGTEELLLGMQTSEERTAVLEEMNCQLNGPIFQYNQDEEVFGSITPDNGLVTENGPVEEMRPGCIEPNVHHCDDGGRTTRLDFDLNEECLNCEGESEAVISELQGEIQEEPLLNQVVANTALERTILGTADGRLNKDKTGQRTSVRGVARFAAPLKKALLCNPPMRLKANLPKKLMVETISEGANQRRQAKHKSVLGISLDEQAASLLMKTAGVIGKEDMITEEATKQFGEQLAVPLQDDVVGGMRAAFGLPKDGGTDILCGLLPIVADEDLLA